MDLSLSQLPTSPGERSPSALAAMAQHPHVLRTRELEDAMEMQLKINGPGSAPTPGYSVGQGAERAPQINNREPPVLPQGKTGGLSMLNNRESTFSNGTAIVDCIVTLTLLSLKAYIYIYAFGQIQVGAEFGSSIFDEV